MQPTQVIDGIATLLASLELAKKSWKLALQDARRERPSVHTLAAEGAAARLEQLVARLEEALRRAGATQVILVYEAGQDGFWIARALEERGYRVVVADPASIPVSRQARRVKTDRLDALLLLESLAAWLRGERNRMHVIRIPSLEAEAQRQLARERGELIKEIGQHRDRIVKLLHAVGCWQPVGDDFGKQLEQGRIRRPDNSLLPSQLVQRLKREWGRMEVAKQQLEELANTLLEQLPQVQRERIQHLAKLKAIGQVGAMRLVLEFFWRNFSNRRQVGAALGLTPQPYNSGDSEVDQGISKMGSRRTRPLMIELSWLWNRYQPQSEIAQWFTRRTSGASGSKRSKRIAIVAVARRLAIALWRYLEQGVVPAGAQFKTVAR